MKKPRVSPEQIAEQAAELLSQGVALGAIYGFTEQEYEVMYALGHSMYSNARYLDALKVFGFLIMSDPFERRFVKAYASTLQMLKRYRDAAAYYHLTSIMDMRDPEPTFHTAECLIALRLVADAREALGFVEAQCTEPRHAALKERARGLLELLDRQAA